MKITLCGISAVEACWRMRPAALRKIFADVRASRQFKDLRAATRECCAWEDVPAGDLEKLAGTPEHGGIVALTERPEPAHVHPAMRDEWADAAEKIVFLENISDAGQLASILRVAVLCGVTRVVADEKTTLPALTRSRVWSDCGGAAEALKIYAAESMPGMLRMAGERFFVVGLVREGGRKIDYAKPIAFPGKPVAFLLGGDENCVSAESASRCGYLLHIAEPAGTPLRYAPAELAAQTLPWLFSKQKRAGAGFFARKKEKSGN